MTIVLPYSNRQDCDFAGASSGSWAALGALLATQGAGSVEALFHSGAAGERRPGKDRGKTAGNLGKTWKFPGKTRENLGTSYKHVVFTVFTSEIYKRKIGRMGFLHFFAETDRRLWGSTPYSDQWFNLATKIDTCLFRWMFEKSHPFNWGMAKPFRLLSPRLMVMPMTFNNIAKLQ